MTIPTKMPYDSELTMITGITETYSTSSPTSTGYTLSYYHMPFLYWVVLATVFLYISERIIKEILIRFRQN